MKCYKYCIASLAISRCWVRDSRMFVLCQKIYDVNRRIVTTDGFYFSRKLPSKNSLLGWVQSGKDNSGKDDWTCSKCTLLNAANQSNCSVCLAPRNNLTATPAQPKRKAPSETPSLAGSDSKRLKTQEGKVSQPQPKKMGSVLKSSSDSQQTDCSKIPTCSSHKVRCVMRQTFKENENKGRWFFTCAAVPATKRCNFFQVGFCLQERK